MSQLCMGLCRSKHIGQPLHSKADTKSLETESPSLQPASVLSCTPTIRLRPRCTSTTGWHLQTRFQSDFQLLMYCQRSLTPPWLIISKALISYLPARCYVEARSPLAASAVVNLLRDVESQDWLPANDQEILLARNLQDLEVKSALWQVL